MTHPTSRVLVWSSRVLSLVLVAFLALFATDAFSEPGSPGTQFLGFLVHLLPAAGVLLTALAAWRWPWVGAMAFPTLALLYSWQAWGRFDWTAHAVISGPLVLLGALFALVWATPPPHGPARSA